MIVMMAGLPGTGKSTLAAAAAARLPSARIVSKDVLRAALFDPAVDPYSPQQNDFLLEMMLALAGHWLAGGVATVFLDGRTFSRQYQRERVMSSPHLVLVVECVCPEEVSLARIAGDRSHPARDRNAALYHSVRASWEAVPEPKLLIDTTQPLAESVDRLVQATLKKR